MAQHNKQAKTTDDDADAKSLPRQESSDNPLDSGLRRKFLAFCEDNPSADECRLFEI
jgi:hypothetical protein